MRPRRRISVLVVDDSPVVRQVLARILLTDALIGEVDTAPSGSLALRKINKRDPDVVTLDVEMPGMDGLATLAEIMKTAPRPVIMVSAVTYEGAEKTVAALGLGAVDFIPKPGGRLSRDVAQIGAELKEKVKAVAPLKQKWSRRKQPAYTVPPPTATRPLPARTLRRVCEGRSLPQLVGIGASTGGTEAIRQVLLRLPRDFPVGIVMVQHMPPGFTRSYAQRLNELCHIEVKEAERRDLVLPGRALLAPGHSHMVVRRGEVGSYVELHQGPEVGGHRPSVDVLFDSIADELGAAAVAVLLTGMGRDGASGMRRLYCAGAVTLAQDEESSVVFGMPKAAIQEESVSLVASHYQIGEALRAIARGEAPHRSPGTTNQPARASTAEAEGPHSSQRAS